MSVIAGHSRLRAASAWWWGRCGRLQWLSSILPQSRWNLGHSGPHYTTPRYTHTLATHPHHFWVSSSAIAREELETVLQISNKFKILAICLSIVLTSLHLQHCFYIKKDFISALSFTKDIYITNILQNKSFFLGNRIH